jgi:hypothetical protein
VFENITLPFDSMQRVHGAIRLFVENISLPTDSVSRSSTEARYIFESTPLFTDFVARRFVGTRTIFEDLPTPLDYVTRLVTKQVLGKVTLVLTPRFYTAVVVPAYFAANVEAHPAFTSSITPQAPYAAAVTQRTYGGLLTPTIYVTSLSVHPSFEAVLTQLNFSTSIQPGTFIGVIIPPPAMTATLIPRALISVSLSTRVLTASVQVH